MTNTYIFIASMHYKVHLTVSHSMSFAPSRIHDLLVQQPQFERTNHLSKYWNHSLLNIYSSIQILCAPPTVLHHQRRSLAIIQYSSADSIGPDKRSSDRCVFSIGFFVGFPLSAPFNIYIHPLPLQTHKELLKPNNIFVAAARLRQEIHYFRSSFYGIKLLVHLYSRIVSLRIIITKTCVEFGI